MSSRNRQTLTAFQMAWSSGDCKRLLALVTDDIKYHASIGPEPGQTWMGKDAFCRGVQQMWNHDTGVDVVLGDPIFFDEQAFCGWIYLGDRREVGCDLFTFRGGKIAVKDAYRKCRT